MDSALPFSHVSSFTLTSPKSHFLEGNRSTQRPMLWKMLVLSKRVNESTVGRGGVGWLFNKVSSVHQKLFQTPCVHVPAQLKNSLVSSPFLCLWLYPLTFKFSAFKCIIHSLPWSETSLSLPWNVPKLKGRLLTQNDIKIIPGWRKKSKLKL